MTITPDEAAEMSVSIKNDRTALLSGTVKDVTIRAPIGSVRVVERDVRISGVHCDLTEPGSAPVVVARRKPAKRKARKTKPDERGDNVLAAASVQPTGAGEPFDLNSALTDFANAAHDEDDGKAQQAQDAIYAEFKRLAARTPDERGDAARSGFTEDDVRLVAKAADTLDDDELWAVANKLEDALAAQPGTEGA